MTGNVHTHSLHEGSAPRGPASPACDKLHSPAEGHFTIHTQQDVEAHGVLLIQTSFPTMTWLFRIITNQGFPSAICLVDPVLVVPHDVC